MSQATTETVAPNTSETLPKRSLGTLRVIVHPSYEIGAKEDEFGWETDWVKYKPKTRRNQNYLAREFLPTKPDEVTLLMPPEEPSLADWRTVRRLKKFDPKEVNWTDLYKKIKRKTPYKDNVGIAGDLSDYEGRKPVEEELVDVETCLLARLKSNGFSLTADTEIVLGGEFRDVCVYEVARKIMLLPQVTHLKIDKAGSFTTAYHYVSEVGTVKENRQAQEALKYQLRKRFILKEDKRFLYIEKRPDIASITL